MIKLFLLYISTVFYTDSVRVAKVYDGDTFLTNSGEHVRISEIDAPERNQFFGDSSKLFLESYILYQYVKIERIGRDKYNRTIAKVWFKGRNLALTLTRNGYVWVYYRYGSIELLNAQQLARRLKKGLWKYPNQQPPFKFR